MNQDHGNGTEKEIAHVECNSLSDVRGEGSGGRLQGDSWCLGDKANGSVFHEDWKRRGRTG